MKISTRQSQPRAAWGLEQSGLHPLLAQLYAARGVQSAQEIDVQLKHLLPPSDLLGAAAAAVLLADAIAAQQSICIVADYDCDGATACAVAVRGLRMLGAQRVHYIVPDRVVDGYGLTPPIADRVKASGADVLVTVDNGIASVAGVAHARALGLAVLVTDHHLPGAELPQDAIIVNPNQPGCGFASKHLSGVGVMFYVLMALRAELRARGVFANQPEPKLDVLLPLVALGTVADVVRLDANNRRLVAQGLKRVRAGQGSAGMAALFSVSGRVAQVATAFDFGFALGPRINAAGRLADMSLGIECLLCDDMVRATELAEQLDAINRERRVVEADMRDAALELAEHLFEDDNEAPSAVCVFDPDFHEGVVGIVAARLKDKLHRPVFVFAPSHAPGQEHCLKGSGRSLPGFHLRDALDLVAKRHPQVLLRFGGHAMAAGCTIEEDQFEVFETALNQVAAEWLDEATLTRKLLTDGELAPAYCRPDMAALLAEQVWGQGFEAPVFCDEMQVISQRIVGEKHLSLKLERQGQKIDGIWFGRTTSLPPKAKLAYRLEANEWQGVRRVQCVVEALQE
jgi:single-stranded-DNA-specific exonuclease